ncbi:hypothetical protein ACFLQU_05065 [Verrucomicrobiota bacterium]
MATRLSLNQAAATIYRTLYFAVLSGASLMLEILPSIHASELLGSKREIPSC